jgi:hypothetical protein
MNRISSLLSLESFIFLPDIFFTFKVYIGVNQPGGFMGTQKDNNFIPSEARQPKKKGSQGPERQRDITPNEEKPVLEQGEIGANQETDEAAFMNKETPKNNPNDEKKRRRAA